MHISSVTRTGIDWLLAGLLFAPLTVIADAAKLENGRLSMPLVDDNGQTVAMELQLQPGTFPPRFNLLDSRLLRERLTLDSPWFDGDILVIPEVLIDGTAYWAELEDKGRGRFDVLRYGINASWFSGNTVGTYEHAGWQRVIGEAGDVGVGADGSVWVVGAEDRHGFRSVFRRGQYGWQDFGGDGARLDVGPDGAPWVITNEEEVWTLQHGRWERVHGRATDIGVGADGSVWVTGVNTRRGGHNIYGLDEYGWFRIDGAGVRIDVDPQGYPWIINDDDEIFSFTATGWEKLPGKGKDIGIGADGSVWVIGADERTGGYGLYQYNGLDWDRVRGSARQVSVGWGQPWVVNRDGEIYRGLSW